MHIRSLAVAILLTLLPVISALADDPVLGRASVIDGDTIEIQGKRIRLTGIDAPESSQTCEKGGAEYRCGQQASLALSDKLGAKSVRCLSSGTDRYGRTLGQCFVDGEDVNRWMVQQGHAVAYRQYSTLYVVDEDRAKTEKRGIWAGTFQNPADYRHSGPKELEAVTEKASPVSTQNPTQTTGGTVSGGKHCTHGKPCGNSCISVEKTCHK
jgi:endonuclease YncB( thermonuclease family)